MRRMVLGSAAETARRRLGRSIAALCGAVFCFIALTALACRATAQPLPNARPQGGQVVAGTAQISQTGTLTRIGQGSQRAAIDWSSFDVGSGQQVQFQQPSSSAVTLNRVTSVPTLNCRARTHAAAALSSAAWARLILARISAPSARQIDRKSTRLNSSH